MATHRLGVSALGLALLVAGALAGVTGGVAYHDVQSMMTASATFAVGVLVPIMLGWGLLKRSELARKVAVVLFASLGLLVAVLGLVWVGLSFRIYRSMLVTTVFWLLAVFLRGAKVRSQFLHNDEVQRLSLS